MAPLMWTLGAGLVVLALGGVRQASEVRLPAGHVAHDLTENAAALEGEDVILEGRISAPPVRGRQSTRFVMQARRRLAPGSAARLVGAVQVTFYRSPWDRVAAPFPRVREGDRVRVSGRLSPPPRRRNPADFDYGTYLRRHGIYATLFVDEAEQVRVLEGARRKPGLRVAEARRYVRRQIDRHVPSAGGRAVLSALILGDRSRLTADVTDQFAQTGLLHVLAVSGLHVLLVGFVIYEVARPMLMRFQLGWRAVEGVRAGLTLALLAGYVLLTGAPASVVRAVVMAALLMGGVLVQRSGHALNALGVAACVLLLWRPGQLFEAGFQLSFAAVGGIVVLNPLVINSLPEKWQRGGVAEWLLRMVTVSLAATLGTLPVLLWHFGYVSFAGLVLNVVAIPCTGLTLIGGLLTVVLGEWAFAGSTFGTAADICANVLLQTAKVGAAFEWASVQMRVETVWGVGTLTAVLVAVAQWPRPRLRWRAVAMALVFGAGGVWWGVVGRAYEPRLDALFFDIGQGDAALLSLPGGGHVLIDTGSRTPFRAEAERAILPHLKRYGIRRLDAVVVTHTDSDHLGGLPALLRVVPVGRVIYNGATATSVLYEESVRVLDSLDVPRQVVRAGDTLQFDAAVRARVLSPPGGEEGTGDNESSIVLQLAYGRVRFLLMGDAEEKAERRVALYFGALLASDVVKVGHHGSKTSSALPFVERTLTDSTRAVISVGRRNPFGMPSRRVIGRWGRGSASVLTTATEGAVWMRSDGRRVWRVRWR